MFVMEDFHISMDEALNKVYTSDAYAKLSNTCTGLYYQSPGYVYNLLKDEFASSATNTPTVS